METKRKSIAKPLLIIGAAILVLGGIQTIFGDKPTPSTISSTASVASEAAISQPPPPRKPSPWQFEERVGEVMKDPDSAKFSDEILVRQDNGVYLMCGNVNAKNGFGGYVGKTPFIAGTNVAVVRSPETDAQFVKAWNEKCADRPAESL